MASRRRPGTVASICADQGIGAARVRVARPFVGLATVNPDGSVGLGLHVVTVPSGRGLQIDARISVATGHGPWTDSAGNTGTFVLGASTGGNPRPVPTIPGAAINAAAAGFGTCPAGQYLRGIQATGTVLCEPIGTPPRSASINTVNNVAQDTSIAIGTDGLPVISHWDLTNGDLRVTKCNRRTCQ